MKRRIGIRCSVMFVYPFAIYLRGLKWTRNNKKYTKKTRREELFPSNAIKTIKKDIIFNTVSSSLSSSIAFMLHYTTAMPVPNYE